MARLGPSGLAQLFREIANYVSTRLSNYNTKDELDSILDTKANDNNVVHTSGEETINGVKTFTGSPFVSNYATTNGFFTKLNTIARNEVPSQIHHSAFRVFDKNSKTLGEYCVEKSTSGSSLLHMDVHTEDSEGNDIMESVYLNLSNDGSTVSFHPAKNNKTDLGMSHYKWAKIYSDDVVHTSGDENISGNKYFTQDINVKNSDVDIAVTPSNNLFSCFRFTDKNNANTASLQYSQRTYGVNDICFYVFDADSNSHGFRIRTDNILEPIENNTYSLGSSSSKWSDVYSTNAYIDRVVCTRFTHSVNNGSVYITGGSEYDKGATLVLHGEESSDAGSFIINSRDKTRSLYLVGKPDGTLQWAGQNIALDGNVVHTSGDETIAGNKTFSNRISFSSGYFISTDPNDNSLRISRSGSDHGNNYKIIIQGNNGKIFAPNGFQGNLQGNADTATSANDPNAVHKTGDETINGTKMFTSPIIKKNSSLDLQVNPSSNQYNSFLFTDKNNVVMGYLEHVQTTTGINVLGLTARDKNNGSHGIQVTSEDNVIPLGNGVVNLGLSGSKWANVYATTFNGNLVGGLTGNVTGNCSGSSGSCTGNAATATQFSANKAVTLTGDVTGTASSKAGWSVATTLANSGVTAGTYGPSADVTGNNNATISVPEITVDAKGRVTSVTNRTLTCKNNTYTVNNATLTIQKNGSKVATFTANSASNVTANITVPTKTSELTNDSGFLTSHQSLSNYLTKTTNVSEMGRYIDMHYDNATSAYDYDVRLYVSAQGKAAGAGNFNIQANAAYAPAPAANANDTRIATTKWVNDKGYVTLNSLAGGNSAGSLKHSVGSLILARCSSSALANTKSYANVAGQQLYPCRTEIYTMYASNLFTPIVVRYSNDSSIGSGTWRYLGGSNLAVNNAASEIYGMFLRVA
jgi:hypothetical protein